MTLRFGELAVYSVFLVEDEIVIREGIQQLKEWEENGFYFVGEAPDGELAWPMIQKLKPDIVITDIKMPFMDGLALSKLIKHEMPQTVIIILSGYDDFSYAQEAIKIGVDQYLLKPLSKNQLLEVLREMKKQKDQQVSQEEYYADFNGKVQEYLTFSKRSLFDALVSGQYTVSELVSRAQDLNIDLVAEQYNIILLMIEDIEASVQKSVISEVHRDLTIHLEEQMNQLFFCLDSDIIAVLVKRNQGKIEELTQQCIAQIKLIPSIQEKVESYRIVFGEPVTRLSALSESYKNLRKQLFAVQEDQTSNVGSAVSLKMDYNLSDVNLNNLELDSLEQFIFSGTTDQVESQVDSYFNQLGREGMQSVLFRHYVIMNIQLCVTNFLEKLNGTTPEEIASFKNNSVIETALESFESSREYIIHLLTRALEVRGNILPKSQNSSLFEALIYMQENYTDSSINLNVVAGIANVTPSHFSAMFSQKMCKTFVEYLTELRMEKARELLSYTGQNSSEIAYAVGYNDSHYFSHLFKKIHGVSPREFRKTKGS